MTLCKYRPQRTYDAQYIIEQHDAKGLMKGLRTAAGDAARDGLASTPYIIRALLAFETLFGYASFNGEVDRWTDFLPMFLAALEEVEGE